MKDYTTKQQKRRIAINAIEKTILNHRLSGDSSSARELAKEIYNKVLLIIKHNLLE